MSLSFTITNHFRFKSNKKIPNANKNNKMQSNSNTKETEYFPQKERIHSTQYYWQSESVILANGASQRCIHTKVRKTAANYP